MAAVEVECDRKRRGREDEQDEIHDPRRSEEVSMRRKHCAAAFSAWRIVRQRKKIQDDATQSSAADVLALADAFDVMMRAQKQQQHQQETSMMVEAEKEAKPPPPCESCKAANSRGNISCGHCLGVICDACLRECAKCGMSFCPKCTMINYSTREELLLCLRCEEETSGAAGSK